VSSELGQVRCGKEKEMETSPLKEQGLKEIIEHVGKCERGRSQARHDGDESGKEKDMETS
jgi:hypothetical protein